ncbi:MAG TPA: GGDEF domain-containing protein [Pyrinomonadaceae bacterium]
MGGLVLFGWALDVEALKRVFPRLVAMNPVTALALILLGLSLRLSGAEGSGRKTRLAAGLCAALAAAAGLLKLTEVVFGRAAGVDQLLFAGKLAGDLTGQPNRMAPNTALNLLLSGCALLLLNVKVRGGFRVAQSCIVGSVLASLIPVVGYAYGTRMLYGVGQFIPMALHTAVTFLALGVGSLFARPGRGLTVAIVDKGVSGVMARRLLPAVIALPVVIGWLRLEGQRLGLYENELGVALMAVAHILILATLVWWSSFQLFRVDGRRRRAEAQLQELTLTDELTGLRNRRGFFLLTEQEFKLARNNRTGIQLWLIYADLDGLKKINDGLGHDAGSRAIVQTAEVLRSTFRDSDIIARLGGDEFVVLAVGNAADSGSIMAARLRENLRGYNLRERLPYRLSLSVGVLRVDAERAASIEDVLKEADQAMYADKRGRKERQGSGHSWNNEFA